MSEYGPKRGVEIHLPPTGVFRATDLLPAEEGYHVGEFPIIGIVSEGGFSDVYLDKNTNAIKVSRTDIPTIDLGTLFLKEGRIHEVVTGSPHIVPLKQYGSGSNGEERHYIVTEFQHGGSVHERILQKQLDVGQAVTFISHAAQGLHATHEKGYVYGDTKPSNLLISISGEEQEVVLADFGSAVPLHDLSTTRHPSILYAAPEQLLDVAAAPAADTYALALTAGEMFLGEPFFDHSERQHITFLLSHRGYDTVIKARTRSLRHRNLKAFEAPIKQSLNREPDNRHADPMAFARDLSDRYAEMQADDGKPPRTMFDMRRRRRRRI